MATPSNNLEVVSRLRARKSSSPVTEEEPSFKRGTYVWGKMNQAHWPGIVLSPEDVQQNEQKYHYNLFLFGVERISNVLRTGVELFAINFNKHYNVYEQKNIPLWKKAISESITNYGDPYTFGMEYDALVKFACSNQMQEVDFSSHLHRQDLPEFVKLKIRSRNVLRKDQVTKSKKLSMIYFDILNFFPCGRYIVTFVRKQ